MPPKLQIPFYDSSDEGNSHVAPIDVLPDLTVDEGEEGNRKEKKEKSPGWMGTVTERIKSRLPDPSRFLDSGEPFATEPRANERALLLETEDQRDYFDYFADDTTDSFSDSTSEKDSYEEGNASNDVDEDGNIQIDLRETILQYQRTPADFYINIILATLKCNTTTIDGYCFSAAAGNPFLIKTLLDSGYVDENDEIVADIIQEEIDKVVQGNPYDGQTLTSDQADYLRCLFKVKSARITQDQMTLLIYSGFDFIKMLSDNSHLTADLEPPPVIPTIIFGLLNSVNFVTGWISLFIDLMFIMSSIWITVYWFSSDTQTNNGYWTIMVHVGGYVVNCVVIMFSEETKIRHYDDELWRYPDSNLSIVPIFPLHELFLVVTALRYELLENKREYFVIRSDLKNGIALQQISHGLFYAIPQVMVQMFLFDSDKADSSMTDVCFYLLFGSGCASFAVGLFAYIKLAIFRHSCTPFGFAFVSAYNDDRKQSFITPSDVVTRLVLFTTMSFFLSIAVSMLVFLLNISYDDCSSSTVVLLSVFVGVAGLNIIAFFLVLIYAEFSRAFGLLALPCIIMKASYLAYASSRKNEEGDCLMIKSRKESWMISDFVLFGCSCIMFLIWLIFILIEAVKHKRIEQNLVDRCFVKWVK